MKEESRVSKQFQRFMENVEREKFHLIYAQVRRDGKVIDDWVRFASRARFESYSSCKSFTALAAGIAIDEGLITLDERVSDSFREESWDVTEPYVREITVRDMLTMSSGMEKPIFFRESRERAMTKDWVRYFYEKGSFVHKPGMQFLYNNANPYMIGCLIEKKAGKNLLEYLRYRLFEPLEIHNPDWTMCPMGHTVAANGMAINVDELGNFGQMLLEGGIFKGRRIVSEDFVKDMTRRHITSNEAIPGCPEKAMGYGYQIWVDDVHGCAYLWGIWGQYCIVMPEKGIVITIQALQDDDGGSNGAYALSPLRMRIWEDLVTQY